MRGELVEQVEQLDRSCDAWRELAHAAARPACHPEWLLAWWRHAAPAGARLTLALAWDGDELAAVAPAYESRGTLGLRVSRFLASDTSLGVEPLCVPGRERDVAAALAGALGGTDVLRFEGISGDSPWPEALRLAWPGGGSLLPELELAAPSATLDGSSLDDWLAGRSQKFRKAMRRASRQLADLGSTIRLATPETAAVDLRSFADLHHARWADRGGSGVLNDRVERMLAAAGPELVADQRLRVWSIDVEGRTIASEVFLTAGSTSSSWLGGFDAAYEQYEPSKVLILQELGHASERGQTLLDLGAGDQEFKYRFADGEARAAWCLLVPAGGRGLSIRARLAPGRAKRAVGGRLGEERKALLRDLVGRMRLP